MEPFSIALIVAANLAFTAWRDDQIKHKDARERLQQRQERKQP